MTVLAEDVSQEPIQQFDFDADLVVVVDYVMGGVDWRRGKQHRIDELSLEDVNRPWDKWRATLYFVPTITTVASEIGIWIDLTRLSKHRPDDLRKTPIGRITLRQTEPGRCTALLYQTSEARFSDKEFDETFRFAASRIVGRWWHELIVSWKRSHVIDRLIADEVLVGLTREDVFTLVNQFVEVVSYSATRIFPDDPKRVAQIALFSRRAMANPDIDTLTPQLASIVVRPPTGAELTAKIAQLVAAQSGGVEVKPFTQNEYERFDSVRVQVWCRTDWKQLPFDVGFPPCHVAADIMRYLLRVVEGEGRADAWQPLPDMSSRAEHSDSVVFIGWDEKALRGSSKIRLLPRRVAQVVEHVSLSLGYIIRERYDLVGDSWHFVIGYEDRELGRVTVEPTESWPRYFSTSMPQLTGVGERTVHRKTESVYMQPVHPTEARFSDLVEAIHERIMEEIDFAERMAGNIPATRQPTDTRQELLTDEQKASQHQQDVPSGKGWAFRKMTLDYALAAMKKALGYLRLGHDILEQAGQSMVVQVTGEDRLPLARITIEQEDERLHFDIWFDSLLQARKAHELELIKELEIALNDSDDGLLSLTYNEAKLALERVFAENSEWSFSRKEVGSTIRYLIGVPNDNDQISILISPIDDAGAWQCSMGVIVNDDNQYPAPAIIPSMFRPSSRFYRRVRYAVMREGAATASYKSPLVSHKATADKPTGNSNQTTRTEAILERVDSEKPWEMIPDNNWDRAAVRGLWEGKEDPEIAKSLSVAPKSVTNRLSNLRRLYPSYVPTRAELRQKRRLG